MRRGKQLYVWLGNGLDNCSELVSPIVGTFRLSIANAPAVY